jgi:DNA transposition AAA+ family ATPase
MTKEFIELFEKSKMTKADFCRAIGMRQQRLSGYLRSEIEMSKAYYEMYKKNYEIHVNNEK